MTRESCIKTIAAWVGYDKYAEDERAEIILEIAEKYFKENTNGNQNKPGDGIDEKLAGQEIL